MTWLLTCEVLSSAAVVSSSALTSASRNARNCVADQEPQLSPHKDPQYDLSRKAGQAYRPS